MLTAAQTVALGINPYAAYGACELRSESYADLLQKLNKEDSKNQTLSEAERKADTSGLSNELKRAYDTCFGTNVKWLRPFEALALVEKEEAALFGKRKSGKTCGQTKKLETEGFEPPTFGSWGRRAATELRCEKGEILVREVRPGQVSDEPLQEVYKVFPAKRGTEESTVSEMKRGECQTSEEANTDTPTTEQEQELTSKENDRLTELEEKAQTGTLTTDEEKELQKAMNEMMRKHDISNFLTPEDEARISEIEQQMKRGEWKPDDTPTTPEEEARLEKIAKLVAGTNADDWE